MTEPTRRRRPAVRLVTAASTFLVPAVYLPGGDGEPPAAHGGVGGESRLRDQRETGRRVDHRQPVIQPDEALGGPYPVGRLHGVRPQRRGQPGQRRAPDGRERRGPHRLLPVDCAISKPGCGALSSTEVAAGGAPADRRSPLSRTR